MSTDRRIATADDLVKAVLYAFRCGCFLKPLKPKPGASIQALTRWGALQHLHDVVARLPVEGKP